MGLTQRVALTFRINRFIAGAEKRRVQHIHAHFAWFNCTVALIVAERLGIGYSVTAHAQDIYFKPENLEEKLTHARFVVTCTEFNRAHIERQFGAAIATKVRVNYHGIRVTEYGPAAHPGNRIGVLAVGRLVEMKGFQFLIQALSILRRHGRSIQCTIAGHGPQFEYLTRLARELGLEQSVSFPGFVPHERLRAMYAEHAVFVLPSVTTEDGQRDGIPNVILEAMASGLPVVSTINSGIPEAVVHDETGLLVPPGDPDKLADAIEQLCADAGLRSRLAEKGRQAVAAKFDLRRNVEDLCRIFKESVSAV
jgi:glycosyltransferase involved in cell wall biosynthesis